MLAFPRSRALRAALSGAFVTFAVASCSLLVTDGRCSQDADCLGRAPAGSGAVCRSGACITSAVGPADGGDGAVVKECTTNKECIDKLGDYHICEKTTFTCQSLGAEGECVVKGDTWRSDDALYIGTLFNTGGGDQGASPDALEAIRKVASDFEKTTGGLPRPGGGASRPLVILECNQGNNFRKVADHLANKVRVPAVIGAATSYVTINAFEPTLHKAGVFVISPYASSPALTDLPDDGLVWRTYPSDALQGKAIPKLINDIIASADFKNARPAQTEYKVGIAWKDDTYGQALLEIVSGGLNFPGKGPENPVSQKYQNLDELNTPDDQFIQDSAEFLAKGPYDIVMILGTSEGARIFNQVENQGFTPPPYYIMPDGIASSSSLSKSIEEIIKQASDKPAASKELRKRIRGSIVNVFEGATYEAFALSFNGNPINGSNAYDAAYALAYAIFAIGPGKEVTGANIAQGMRRLVGGETQELRPSSISTILQRLTSGANVSLQGTGGLLDFNLETGDVTATGANIWCLSETTNSAGNIIPLLVPKTGQDYDEATDSLRGTFPTGPTPCKF